MDDRDAQPATPLNRSLHGQEPATGGKRNGELLRLAAAEFDVFVSGDRNIPHQQVVSTLPLGVVIVAAGGLKMEHIRPHVGAIRAAAEAVLPGQIVFVPERR